MASVNKLQGVDIGGMVRFLNPPKGTMNDVAYAALRVQRKRQWNQFIIDNSTMCKIYK